MHQKARISTTSLYILINSWKADIAVLPNVRCVFCVSPAPGGEAQLTQEVHQQLPPHSRATLLPHGPGVRWVTVTNMGQCLAPVCTCQPWLLAKHGWDSRKKMSLVPYLVSVGNLGRCVPDSMVVSHLGFQVVVLTGLGDKHRQRCQPLCFPSSPN